MMVTAESFFADYGASVRRCVELVPPSQVAAVAELLLAALRQGRQVFVLGNGGSAATASHMACDLLKATATPPGSPWPHPLRIMALTDNVPLITAIANDISYEAIFSEQLKAWLQPGDLVIVITASGNSPNVLDALATARHLGAFTVGFLGFGGGRAREMLDLAVIVPSHEYGPVEDMHMIFEHMLTAYVKRVLAEGLEPSDGRNPLPLDEVTKAVVLAAGKGTRLHPLTADRPKPMLPIDGTPLLQHTLRWLRRYGVRDVAINLHHKPDAIRAHLRDGHDLGIRVTYSYEETLQGTAGALRLLAPFIGRDRFAVVYGDVLTDLDLEALVKAHRAAVQRDPATLATISLYRVPNPTEVGLVELEADGRVTRFVEKPRPEDVFGNLASAGVLIMEASVLDHIPPDEYCDIGLHLLPSLLSAGLHVYGWELPDRAYLLDIGTPEKYARAQLEWADRQSTPAPDLVRNGV